MPDWNAILSGAAGAAAGAAIDALTEPRAPAPTTPTPSPSSTPASGPTILSVGALALFPLYANREEFARTHNGAQAPSWQEGGKIKRWYDSGAIGKQAVTYTRFNPATGKAEPFTVAGAWAARVNLPGRRQYVKAPNPAPTSASYQTATGRQAVNVDTLCYRDEAHEIARELGFGPDDVFEARINNLAARDVDWGLEQRRIFAINWHDNQILCAALLRQKNSAGLGAPGKWDLDANSFPWWEPASEPDGAGVTDEEFLPIRDLAPGERFVPTLTGWQVQKGVATASDPAVDAKLDLLLDAAERIEQRVQAIEARLASL